MYKQNKQRNKQETEQLILQLVIYARKVLVKRSRRGEKRTVKRYRIVATATAIKSWIVQNASTLTVSIANGVIDAMQKRRKLEHVNKQVKINVELKNEVLSRGEYGINAQRVGINRIISLFFLCT